MAKGKAPASIKTYRCLHYYLIIYSLTLKQFIYNRLQRPILRCFRRIIHSKMRRLGLQGFIEPQDIIGRYKIYYLRRCDTIDLLPDDMPDTLGVVRKQRFHLLAAVKTLYDLRDVQTGLHV